MSDTEPTNTQQTERDELAELIRATVFDSATGQMTWQRIADVVLAAGWTAPAGQLRPEIDDDDPMPCGMDERIIGALRIAHGGEAERVRTPHGYSPGSIRLTCSTSPP